MEMSLDSSNLLRKIEEMQREPEYMKRDLMHLEEKTTRKPSLFVSVSGEDITDEMIEKAKRELFREARMFDDSYHGYSHPPSLKRVALVRSGKKNHRSEWI